MGWSQADSAQGGLIVCCATEREVGVSLEIFGEQQHQVPHVPSPSNPGEQSQGVWVLQVSFTKNWCL